MITQPLIGATTRQAFRATYDGVTAFPNVLYDKQAPFTIGTMGWALPDTPGANQRVIGQFVRIAVAIAIGGTAITVANGVATAASGGTWVNDTGLALAAGDYVWLTAGVTPALAADEASSLAADEAAADAYGKKVVADEKKAKEKTYA